MPPEPSCLFPTDEEIARVLLAAINLDLNYLQKHLLPRNGGVYRASTRLTEPATGQPSRRTMTTNGA